MSNKKSLTQIFKENADARNTGLAALGLMTATVAVAFMGHPVLEAAGAFVTGIAIGRTARLVRHEMDNQP